MKVTFFNGSTSTSVTTAPQIISGGAALPPGVEGQVLGYGPGGVPRALDAAGPPYDDTGIKQRVQTLESTVAGKADVGHGHAVSAITGLQGILDGKAAVGHQHDLAAVSGLQAALDGKASATHTHGIAGVTGLQGALDGKASASHQHDIAGVSGLQDIIDALTARIEALEGGGGPVFIAPAFTTQPALLGSTALGSTITVSLGSASGTPAPVLTGALTRPGKAPVAVLDGDTFQIEASDQGGTITLDVTATNSAGSATAHGEMAVTAPITAQRVIILTDYAGDCDDAMALGVACAAHKRGDIHILGVVATSSIETSAPGVHGQLAAYGMQSIPVYAYQGSIGTYNNNISAPVRDAHGIPGQTRAAYEDDLTGLRRMLAGSPDGSVKVIDVGAPISTARLLDSPADAISALTGMQLASAKVSGLWMMAGDFSGGAAEYNATRHIASTQRVYHDWPTPIYAHGSEVGSDVNTGPHRSFEMPGLDPIKTAFDAYGTAQRMSWDPITVHHAIYGNGTLYRHAGEGGTIAVAADGKTAWSATPAGNRVQVAKLAGQGTISAAIVNFVYGTDLIPINTQPQWAFPLDEGAGVVVEADTGAKGSIINAAWAASPARLNFTSDHALIPLRSADHDKDFVLGAIIRLGAVTGAQVIMSRTGTLTSNKFWQFRNNAGALEWVSFGAAGTGTVIASAAGALVANTWTLVTARVTDTGVLLRINGAEVKAGTFPARNKLLDPAVPVMVSGRSNTTTWSGNPLDRMTSGDVGGLALRLASSDVAALEADLRAIAAAKGITLPGSTTPTPPASPYQPDMTTGRIAQITTSFGGRPNVTPATYYFDGQDELASMAMGA